MNLRHTFNSSSHCSAAFFQYLRRGHESIPLAPFPAYSSKNNVRLLVHGDEILPAMLDMIEAATETIRWNVLLFRPDSAGAPLAEALCRAAMRGVQVQLAFDFAYTTGDTFGAKFSAEKRSALRLELQKLLDIFKDAGVRVHNNRDKLYPKPDKSPDADPEAKSLYDHLMRHICIRWDHFDHRKVLIVDASSVIVGGANVGNEYLYRIAPDLRQDMTIEAEQREQEELPEAWEKWVDVAVRIDGEVTAAITREFDIHWAVMGDHRLPEHEQARAVKDGTVRVQPLHQHPGHGEISAAVVAQIDAAKSTIYAASPYTSYPPILNRLMAASRRGVKVVIVYPNQHNDVQLSAKLFQRHIADLLAAGVVVYENNLRMAHYKVMVVDAQVSLIGSFNLNYRSFKHDFELNVAIDDAAFAQAVMQRVFETALHMSQQVHDYPRRRLTPFQWILEPFS